MNMIAIACPSCGTRYKLKGATNKSFACKRCGAKMTASGAATARRGAEAKAIAEKRMATRLLVIGGVATVLILAIVAFASNEKAGYKPAKESDTTSTARSTSALQDEAQALRRAEEARERRAIGTGLGKRFLEALAANDESQVRELFLFDRYYAMRSAAAKPGDEDMNYAAADEAKRATMERHVLDSYMDPARAVYIKKHLLPTLERNEKAALVDVDQGDRPWRLKYQCQDDEGTLLFDLNLTMDVRPGIDADLQWGSPDNWGIVRMETQWLSADAATGQKRQKSMVDPVREAEKEAKRKERASMRAAGGGPPEAEPEILPLLEGTGEIQEAALRAQIQDLLGDQPRKSNQARRTLTEAGKVAIPLLLNELVGRNHRDNEAEIFQAWFVIQTLRDITGEQFGYAPGTGASGGSLATVTPDDRERAVRRWFAWWKRNAKSWSGRKEAPEDER